MFYKKMSLKNPKTLRKCQENLQPQMPELQFLRTLKVTKLNKVYLFSYLKFFFVSIIKKIMFIVIVKPN